MKVILWWNLSCDESYLVMKVSWWWKLASDEGYLVMKFKIVKEVKRSDGLWRFACGDVFLIWSPHTWGAMLAIFELVIFSSDASIWLKLLTGFILPTLRDFSNPPQHPARAVQPAKCYIFISIVRHSSPRHSSPQTFITPWLNSDIHHLGLSSPPT